MKTFCTKLANAVVIRSKRGVTAIEYGLIAALVALAIITGITLVGTNLNGLFNYIGGKVSSPA